MEFWKAMTGGTIIAVCFGLLIFFLSDFGVPAKTLGVILGMIVFVALGASWAFKKQTLR